MAAKIASAPKIYAAELFGTFCLVFIGCGSVAVAGSLEPGLVGIAAAFGLTVTAMAYAIGPISGAHLNPAVTIGAYLADRVAFSDLPGYIIAQSIGAILAALLLMIITAGGDSSLGANGFGDFSPGKYGYFASAITEFAATFIFVTVILNVTHKTMGAGNLAGLVIGLTLFILHFPFANVTGLSVNPARSLGPALFSGTAEIGQFLIMFLIFPTLGGAAAGIVAKMDLLSTEVYDKIED